jgi:hypothetical protein
VVLKIWRPQESVSKIFKRLANQESLSTRVRISGLSGYSIPRFQTSDPQYTWLKEGEFLSHAVGEGDRLKISIYRASSEPLARMRLQPSVLEPNDPLSVTGVGFGVGYLDDGGAGSIQLAKQFHDFLGLIGMQVTS